MTIVLRNVFTKSLRDARRGLIGWGISIVVLVLLEAALWPSVRNMAELQQFLENYPEALRKLFNLDQFATGTGFMNAELYSLLLPILFLVYAIGRGARAIAGEEETGTLDVLLVTRVSPVSLIVQQAAALAVAVAALGTVLFAAVMTWSPVFDLGIGVADAAGGSLALVLLHRVRLAGARVRGRGRAARRGGQRSRGPRHRRVRAVRRRRPGRRDRAVAAAVAVPPGDRRRAARRRATGRVRLDGRRRGGLRPRGTPCLQQAGHRRPVREPPTYGGGRR